MLYIWRHPKPMNPTGLCFGQSDMPVHRRKIKRLARCIERYACAHQLPKVIWVSPLQRSRQVGEALVKRGFICHVAPDLMEINFGAWENRLWSDIPKREIDEWCDDFAQFAPDGGESLQQLFDRVHRFLSAYHADAPLLIVGHAGWITAATIIGAGQAVPKQPRDWPRAVQYGALSKMTINT